MARKAKKAVEFRVYDLPIEFPVLLLDGDEWRISDKLSDRLHFHNCFEIGICHSDSGILMFEGATLPFRAGDVSCISRHVLHTTCSAKGTKSRWSYLFVDMHKLFSDFGGGEMPDLTALERLESHSLLGRDEYPRIHFLITAIIEELQAQSKHYRTVVRSLFLVLYHELLRMQESQDGPADRQSRQSFALKPALEHIHNLYMQPITIDELAEMCHLSTTHFRRTFLSIMGTTPLEFIISTRINQACVRLLTTDDSVLAIAESVGFASISSFNRSFLQIMGVSPKAYRNPSVRENIVPHKKYLLHYKGWMTPDLQPEFVAEGVGGESSGD